MSTEEEAKVEVPTEEGAEGGQEEETVKEEESNAHFEPLVSRSLLCVRASKVWCVPFLTLYYHHDYYYLSIYRHHYPNVGATGRGGDEIW